VDGVAVQPGEPGSLEVVQAQGVAVARKKNHPFISQAAQLALIRYGPEISALTQLQTQAGQNLQQSVNQAAATSAGIQQAARQARPEIRQVYNRAGLNQARNADTLVNHDLAALGPVADSIRAAAGLEQTQGLRHLREAKAAALNDLAERRVQAAQGRQYQVQNALQTYGQASGQVQQRRVALGRELGAFQAATVSDARSAHAQARAQARAQVQQQRFAIRQANMQQRAAFERLGLQLSQQERSSMRTAGLDPNTGLPIPGGKLDPNSPMYKSRSGQGKPNRNQATRAAHNDFADGVGDILSVAQQFKARGFSRDKVRGVLRQGAPARSQVDQNGVRTSSPAIAPVPADLRMQVALDVAYDGHLWRGTEQLLRRRGFNPKALGFPTYEAFQRRQRNRKPPTAAQQAGGIAGLVLGAIGSAVG
jgi:hypothetical protein